MNLKEKNLIVITVDDLRLDAIGKNPFSVLPGINTSTLDSLVERGNFFTNCITTAPYTTNAHASIVTGRWPYHHGVIDFFRNALEGPTIFSILKDQGYKTLWQTDFPFLLGPTLGFTKGIDKFIKKDEMESFTWLEDNKKEKIACFFHFANVHEPFGFIGNKADKGDYQKKTKALLERYNIEFDQEVSWGRHFLLDEHQEEDLLWRQNYQKILKKLFQEQRYDEIMNLYVEGVNYFDQKRLAPFLKTLKIIGLLDNSLLVIVGDHGEAWDKHNQGHYKGDKKNSLTEEIIKVPLIFVGSEVDRNKTIQELVRTIDIVPTSLAYLGIKTNDKLDGVNLFSNQNDLTAFSQHWVSDTGEITTLMKQSAVEDKLAEAEFDSHLESSIIFKSHSWFLKNLSLEQGDIGLKKDLEIYNQKTNKKMEKMKARTNKKEQTEIAQQLRDLGYNI